MHRASKKKDDDLQLTFTCHLKTVGLYQKIYQKLPKTPEDFPISRALDSENSESEDVAMCGNSTFSVEKFNLQS